MMTSKKKRDWIASGKAAQELENYLNPAHPEYDPDFALQLMDTDAKRTNAPQWYTPEQRAEHIRIARERIAQRTGH